MGAMGLSLSSLPSLSLLLGLLAGLGGGVGGGGGRGGGDGGGVVGGGGWNCCCCCCDVDDDLEEEGMRIGRLEGKKQKQTQVFSFSLGGMTHSEGPQHLSYS